MALTSMVPPLEQTPSFSCFSSLAPELRRQIWNLCLPTSRIISISYVGGASCTKYAISSPPPVLLYINQESRSFALERYERYFIRSWPSFLFDQCLEATDCSWHDQHYVWVDLERDILFYENDFHRISSSQWFRVHVTRPGRVHDRKRLKNISPRNHLTPSLWMKQFEPTDRLDFTIAHREKSDDEDTINALQQVVCVGVPFDEVYLGPNNSFCGTGYRIQVDGLQRNLKELTDTLEKYFSSLRNVIVVVDREREDAKRKESEEKKKERDKLWKDFEEENKRGEGYSTQEGEKLFGFDFEKFLDDSKYCLPTGCLSGKNIELVDFKSSERYDSMRYTEMEYEVRDWFRKVGVGDTKPWSASAVKLMEMRPKQEQVQDFTWLPVTK